MQSKISPIRKLVETNGIGDLYSYFSCPVILYFNSCTSSFLWLLSRSSAVVKITLSLLSPFLFPHFLIGAVFAILGVP